MNNLIIFDNAQQAHYAMIHSGWTPLCTVGHGSHYVREGRHCIMVTEKPAETPLHENQVVRISFASPVLVAGQIVVL